MNDNFRDSDSPTPPPAWTSPPGTRRWNCMKTHVARTMIPGVVSDIGGFGGLFELDLTGMQQARCWSPAPTAWAPSSSMAFLHGQARHRGHRLRGHVRQRHHLRAAQSPCSSWTTSPAARTSRRRSRPSSPAWPRAASRPAAPSSAARPPRCPASIPEDEYDLAGFSVGVVDKDKILDNTPGAAGRRAHRPALLRRPLQRLLPGAQGLRRGARRPGRLLSTSWAATLGEALLTPTRIYVKPVLALHGAGRTSRPSATSPAAASMRTSPAACPTGCTATHRKERRPDAAHLRPASRRRATSPSGTCSTPSTWASAWRVVVSKDEADKALRGPERRRASDAVRHGRDRRRATSGVEPMVKARSRCLVSGGGTNLQALLDAQAARRPARTGRSCWSSPATPRPTPWTRAANAGVPAVVCRRKAAGEPGSV